MADVISSVPKTFANNFWGKDDAGYTVLTSKMANSKKTFDDLKAFYTARSSLHEEFGKKLLKYLKNELGREETGTLGVLLASAYRELEMTAQANIELAQKIKVNLELRLDNFILEQKDKRKLVQTVVYKAHRNKQLHAAHVAKAKEKYETECAKQISYEGQLSTAGLREADRLRQKLDKCNHDIKIFEQEYKSACTKLADATALWDTEWKDACDKYQEMEEKRVEFMHHSFSVYVNILSTASNQDQESFERFWQALDQCDPKKDISIFIDEKGTGPMIPGPPVYVHYMDDPAKTLPTYHAAQFPDDRSSASSFSSSSSSSCSSASVPSSDKAVVTSNGKPNFGQQHCYNGTSQPEAVPNNTFRKLININDPQAKLEREHSNRRHGANTSSVAPPTEQQRVAKQLPAINDSNKYSRRKSRYVDNHNDVTTTAMPTLSETTTLSALDSDSRSHLDNDSGTELCEDVVIDPRAKVVFAIGNNVFEVDHQQSKQQSQRKVQKGSQHMPPRQKISECSTGLDGKTDHSFDVSIRELLEELGVDRANDNSDAGKERKISLSKRHEVKSMHESNEDKLAPKQTNRRAASRDSHNDHHQYQKNHQTNLAHDQERQQQPSMYTQLQQHYASHGDQQVSHLSSQEQHDIMYESSIPLSLDGIQWARALYDHHGENGYLTFSRGSWLAVVHVENDPWCFAYVWDEVNQSLSAIGGYVASNLLQFVQ